MDKINQAANDVPKLNEMVIQLQRQRDSADKNHKAAQQKLEGTLPPDQLATTFHQAMAATKEAAQCCTLTIKAYETLKKADPENSSMLDLLLVGERERLSDRVKATGHLMELSAKQGVALAGTSPSSATPPEPSSPKQGRR
jgi:hypothetical protein